MENPVDIPPEDGRLCEECKGEGTQMTMVCYGGPPIEKKETCEACEGEGYIYASES